jgi:hypothetical protein
MEDAHATILDLQANFTGTNEKPTDPEHRLAFFGVYDGHGGDKVALFTGENLHKIISRQDAFAKGDIEQAMKDGFLATDRAILEGLCHAPEVPGVADFSLDPRYEEEVSGCTASTGIISQKKIWVVCYDLEINIGLKRFKLTGHRRTLVIHDRSWVSRDVQSPFHSTTSLRMRVSTSYLTGRYIKLGVLTNYHRREGPYHGCWWIRRLRSCQWQPCPVPCYR